MLWLNNTYVKNNPVKTDLIFFFFFLINLETLTIFIFKAKTNGILGCIIVNYYAKCDKTVSVSSSVFCLYCNSFLNWPTDYDLQAAKTQGIAFY